MRPKVLEGTTERIETPRGRVYITINKLDGKVFEIFIDSHDPEARSLCRITALALQAGVDINEVIDHLRRTEDREGVWDSDGKNPVLVKSISQAIALALEHSIERDASK